jgi:hypothetical protein
MSSRTHVPTCDGTCLAFQDHARHFCCTICRSEPPESPPSPASTVGHCPSCRLPADLSEELAKLSAVVAELADLVVELHASLVDDELEERQ